MKNLDGAHVLLTGGSRGLGPMIARALAREGARLTLAARSATALLEAAKSVRAGEARVHTVPVDLSDEASCGRLVSQAEAGHGPVDVLVSNAGIEHVAPYPTLPPEEIAALVRTNLLAPLLLARLVLPGMIHRGRGHLVAISSLGGKKGPPYSSPYAATKAGLIAWSSGLRAELRDSGIGVSVICPGFVSEVGMFADHHARAPRLLGTSSPEAVTRAVVDAIRHDRGELLVNPGPVRPLLVLDALSPRLGDWLLRRLGVHAYFREQASRPQAGQ